ncbi:SDR family NAD(P)-dependent oxidoreductase [Nocardia asteroides]|uniref:SDR family NAD(P)-dependent oxidoreductase n=1 Tax=Nocardia asteroides TaxID=1824 RepID=UPI001E2A0255|nr:SDR family NAD(P)-dependent oxidoreductase [Nocardia asteroides]UGT59912.1 SDR family NAD(P)-dependent oxidoreductase [Nocardia asteroides]
MTRTWFITGANRGLGRAFTEAALGAGDRVVATARDPRRMPIEHERLIVLPLDVRDRAAVLSAADTAVERAGHVDIVVNNAGYGLVGAVEELSEEQLRDQLEVNFFGALWVSQAFAPHLRARGSGHIVQISTVGAAGSLPLFGAYNAGKWALEGFSAALADELRPFGVHVTLAQLGGFATDWAGSSMRFGTRIPAYDNWREQIFGSTDYPAEPASAIPEPATTPDSAEPAATSDSAEHAHTAPEPVEYADAAPELAARALLDLVAEPNPPLRRIIGPGAHQMVTAALDQRRADYARDPEFHWPTGQ